MTKGVCWGGWGGGNRAQQRKEVVGGDGNVAESQVMRQGTSHQDQRRQEES